METLQAILTRRSIKKYTSKKISQDQIETILKAAMYAPSAKNSQPWHFIVLEDRNDIDQIHKLNPRNEMMLQAPAAIIVCGDSSIEPNIDNLVMSCSAAAQNALLAVHSLGLGSVWVSAYPIKDIIEGIKKYFNLPENIVPFSVIPVGYPDEVKENDDRFHKEKIHLNRW